MNIFTSLKLVCLLSIQLTTASANIETLPNQQTKSRVLDTEPVTPGSLPWIVSIQYVGHSCAGSAIAPRWILTTASCVLGLSEVLSQVRVGSVHHNFGGELVNITQLLPHPTFDRTTMANDIALVYTESNLPIDNEFVRLSTTSDPVFDSMTLTIAGWGFQRSSTGTLSANLIRSSIPIVNHHKCSLAYGEMNFNISEQAMLCAGDLDNGGIGICQGDQGGPMFSGQVSGQRAVLFGIASFSDGCGQIGRPSVFTRVSAYRQWIARMVNVNLL